MPVSPACRLWYSPTGIGNATMRVARPSTSMTVTPPLSVPVAVVTLLALLALFARSIPRRLLLVALFRERRRLALLQHGEVEPARRAHVGAGLREPVAHGAGVGRRTQVEVLAVAVEDRFADVAETVGDRERLLPVHRVDEGRGDLRAAGRRICQPRAVGRPVERRVGEGARAIDGLGHHLANRPGRHGGDVQRATVVAERDARAVGRPRGGVVEAAAREPDHLRRRPCRPARGCGARTRRRHPRSRRGSCRPATTPARVRGRRSWP